MCFVVKQSWHCCLLLLAEPLLRPDYLSQGSWVGQNCCSLSLGTENFSFQSFCAIKEVPSMW